MEEGKIKYAGISEASPEDIRRAHAVCRLSAVQIEWSLWSRDCEVGSAVHIHWNLFVCVALYACRCRQGSS